MNINISTIIWLLLLLAIIILFIKNEIEWCKYIKEERIGKVND